MGCTNSQPDSQRGSAIGFSDPALPPMGWAIMETFDKSWQLRYRASAIHYLKPDTAIRTKGSFPPVCVFAVNSEDEVTLELKSLANIASQTYKADRRSRSHSQLKFPLFAPVFHSNPEYQHEKETQNPHPPKPIGDPPQTVRGRSITPIFCIYMPRPTKWVYYSLFQNSLLFFYRYSSVFDRPQPF